MIDLFLLYRDRPSTVDALTETAEYFLDHLEHPERIDLHGLQADMVHPEHLAMALRTTSKYAHAIPGWAKALDVAQAAARLHRMDINDVLFGLR